MDLGKVQDFFDSQVIVAHYAEATAHVGLWCSEEKVFTRLFTKEDSILELGCGAGRIAVGLHELGYSNLLATDYSKEMIQRARHIAKVLEYPIPFRVCDATELEFEDAIFDGALFGFNGLMQIPGADRRLVALKEIKRVLRPGAWLVFTTHDRDASPHQDFWQAEKQRWAASEQDASLEMFGDRAEQTEHGAHYMHVPIVSEVEALLGEAGFRIEVHAMRSELADEPKAVLDFSDDCRFWVVQKPELS